MKTMKTVAERMASKVATCAIAAAGIWFAIENQDCALAQKVGDSVGTIVSPAPERPERKAGEITEDIHRAESECVKKPTNPERADCARNIKALYAEISRTYERLSALQDVRSQGLAEVRALTEASIGPAVASRKELATAQATLTGQVAEARAELESAKSSAEPQNEDDERLLQIAWSDVQDMAEDQAAIDAAVKSATSQTRAAELELRVIDRGIGRAKAKVGLFKALAGAARAREKTWEANARRADLDLPTFAAEVGALAGGSVPPVIMSEERRRKYSEWRGKTAAGLSSGAAKVVQGANP